jgi:putative salt-induced outer membrane protein
VEVFMNRRLSALVFAVCAIGVCHTAVRAQAPAPPQPPPPPPAQEGTAEFSFVGTTGNAPTSALGLGGEYIARPAPWLFRAKANYVRNESEDELKAEAFRGLFRATRTITDRLSAFAEYGYLHDQFAGIDARNTIDGGITVALVRPQPHQFDVDAGLGYAHEDRVVGENLSTAQALAGARYKYTLSETAEITDDLVFTFSLSDSDDWRTGNSAALTVKITTLFSLKLSNIIRYVNAPPPDFETTDTLTSVALVAKF